MKCVESDRASARLPAPDAPATSAHNQDDNAIAQSVPFGYFAYIWELEAQPRNTCEYFNKYIVKYAKLAHARLTHLP